MTKKNFMLSPSRIECTKNNFLLCKIFAKFLQIINLHTDFRPREESVRYLLTKEM